MSPYTGYCPRCGELMERENYHNCGRVTISKDRLRMLEEIERAASASQNKQERS